MTLGDSLQSKRDDGSIYQPELLDLSLETGQARVAELLKSGQLLSVGDDYEEQLLELYQVNNPTKIFNPDFKSEFEQHLTGLKATAPFWQQGLWAYYPWLGSIVHILPKDDFLKLRTARNRNLINQVEQDKFYHARIGIAGLSVGSNIALALVLQGGGGKLRLADHDRLALTNTNRVIAGVQNLGLPKVVVTARTLTAINPYLELEIFFDGLNPDNLDQFCDGLDVIVDEMDNISIKFLLREQARKRRLPLLMGADNGDNAVIDIERYDLDPNTPFFHGRMGEVTYDGLKGLDKMGIGRLITKHVGSENVTKRMQESLLEIGKTVVSWPQLGGAAILNGAAIAYAVRQVLTGGPLEDNRALISLDEKLEPDYNSPEKVAIRAKTADTFRQIFGL
ncbi:MAG: ThiF family adenylyltransferase [Patescibacteria group bacterium]